MKSKAFAKNLIKVCKKAQAVAISGHQNPDYDAIGSCLGLQEILRQNGIDADIILEQALDVTFRNFAEDYTFVTEVEKSYDVLITVDTADVKLLPKNVANIRGKATYTFNIDHHLSNQEYAQFNFVEGFRSSACEVLFYLFAPFYKLNTSIAKCLYIGIYTDTGGFVYSNVCPDTFVCLSKLLSTGFRADQFLLKCFRTKTHASMEVTQRAFKSLKFYHNDEILVSIVRENDFKETKAVLNETKFIVSYLPNVEGVKVSISISEPVKNEYHVSLRSVCDDVDVSQIASHFGGGGHLRASGLTLKGDFEKAFDALLKQTISVLEKRV